MKTKFYPLSESQKGIYYEWEKDKSLTNYNLPFLYEFPETTDPKRLKDAIRKVIDAHPNLKVRLKKDRDDIVQYYNDKDPVEIRLKKTREEEMEHIISGFIRPFDLTGPALYRVELYQAEKKCFVLFDFHHVIFDGTSLAVFNSDLVKAYNGEELAKESFTGCDYAILESQRKGNAEYIQDEAFFEKKLTGVTMTKLPSVSNKTNEAGYKKTVSEYIGQGPVNDFCTRLKVSPNNLFAGALGICLNRYTREQDIAFCTAHHGRLDQRLQNITGMFVRTLPVVMNVPPAQTVNDLLGAIRTDMLELWKHQAFPFSEMVKKFGAALEITYAFQKGIAEYFDLEGRQVNITLLSDVRTNISLVVYIFQQPHEYEIRCEYNSSLYDHEYMKVFAAAIKNTVLNMLADEHRACSDISILSPEQEAEVIKMSTGSKLDHDRSLSVTDLFRDCVKKSPDSIAVAFEDRKLTYRELDRITDKIAGKLHAAGVQREKVVGVMIERSEYMVIYPLAVLKAGGAYMPLDFTIPAERLGFMIKDADAGYILSEGSLVADHIPGFKGVVINREDIPATVDECETELPIPAPEDLFVLLYTSGSTGIPKGCMLEHRNIVNFCRWYVEEFDITPDDRGVAYANFAFDAHMMDIYPMITSGASVYILPAWMRMDLLRMNQYMEENGLTVAFMTTQIGRQFAEDIENHSLRLLSVGGERLIPTKKPPYRFYNGYGPTECTIYSTVYNIASDYSSLVIGRPLSNVINYIMDKNLQLLPAGVAGELCIGGEGVGRGYLNREELNREKFVTWRGQKLYRSGDLARYNEAGEVEYFARLDSQVKLRGLRIELGEVENVLAGYSKISSAVADVKEIGGVQHLCGYYVAKTEIDPEVLKDYMRLKLTEYMIPTALIRMEKFPLTSNGKVNRKMLPVPQVVLDKIVPPQTETERQLFDIVTEMLKTKDFGINTNLFSLGLTSILAIKFSVAIQKKLGLIVQTKDILKLRTIQNIAAVAAEQESGATDGPAAAYGKREYYPLTENQMGLYYDWEKNRNALQYNIAAELRFSGRIDVRQLKDAVVAVVDAHPYLKTTMAVRGNDVVQLRRDDLPLDILVERNDEEKMESVISSFVRPFNLFGDVLCRFAIHQTASSTYLLFDIHHIIFDGTSMGIFFNDLKEAFEGRSLVPESFTAFDWALEEETLARSAKYAEAEAYFSKLVGSSPMTVFPSSSQLQSAGTSKVVETTIPHGEIEEFCRSNAITASNFFLAVLCLLLNRVTREDQVAVTTVSSGRADNKLAGLMGMFVKTLPVVADIKKQTVYELAKTIQDQVFATMEKEIFPFTKMAEKYGVVPQINFAFQGGIENELYLGSEKALVRFLNLDTVKFPFGVVIYPDQKGYAFSLEFDDTLYQEKIMQRFAETFASTAVLVSGNADRSVAEISLLTEEEKKKILQVSQGSRLDYDRSLTIIDILRKHAANDPGRTAIVDKTSHITYGELDRWSDSLAVKLVSMGVMPDDFVCIMLSRRKEFVVSALAVMKAGGAYVPLDSEYPNDRLLFMLENSEARVFITERGLYEKKRKEGDFKVSHIVFTDEFDFEERTGTTVSDHDALLNGPEPENLAYMIYTSGSTGQPKGVMIAHKSLTSLVAWCARETASGTGDRICCHPSFSFDASVQDIFMGLYAGSTLHIIPSEMRQNIVELYNYLVDNQITGGAFSTQFGMELLNQFELPLRFIELGGEKLLPVRKRKTRIMNVYGPTEFTVSSAYHWVDQESENDNIPIGRPLPNSWAYVVDAGMQLLPRGIAGELCMSGVQIARGYWKRDDLTAEKFIPNPFSTCEDNAKLYRTGDLVRWNENGELEFLGRIDTQVKLRGFRIELGEIESTMKKFGGVASAIADVKEFGGAQHLCGYYTEVSPVDQEKLTDYLKSVLTEYMVPSALIKLQSFPLTPNGKVNRKVLPLPEIARAVEYVAPTSDVEKTICQVYSDILKIEKVGILDNFFEIGGSSMSAIKAIIQIINHGFNLNYGDLFTLKTPQAVARFLSGPEAESEDGEKVQAEDISNYDYSAINRVLEADKPDLWENYREYDLGDVLLTGATGYLGIHVLKELISTEKGKIWCMVRAKGALTPERRLKTLLMYYFSDTFDEVFVDRIVTVDGDITNVETLRSLKNKRISTVINCAASVKHFAASNELDKINVEGVANLVDYCKEEQARLIHISTMSTAGLIEKGKLGDGIVMNESKLYLGQTIDNKYVMGKFKAERLLLQAVSEGLDGKIMRVGNLMGRHSDGEFQINFRSNAFVNILKAYKVLRMFPLSQLVSHVEISPIDCTAAAVVALSRAPHEASVLHTYNNYRLNMANVIYAMIHYGFEISLVSDSVFSENFRKVMQDPRKSEYLSGLLHYRIGENYVAVPDENDYTTTLLYKHGIRWPLADENYSVKLIKLLDEMGFFDEN